MLLLLAACADDDACKAGDSACEAGDTGGTGDTGSGGDVGAWVVATKDALTATCGDITLTVTLHEGGVARLRYVPVGTGAPTRAWGVPAPPAATPRTTWITATAATVHDDAVTVEVLADCRVTVTTADGQVLLADAEGDGWWQDPGGDAPVGVRHALPSGARVYGLGGHNGRLDRRGGRYTNWNTDAYDSGYGGFAPDADPLYLGVPFYVTLTDGEAAGVLTDDAFRLTFDVGATASDTLGIEGAGGVLDQWVIPGPSLGEVIERYTALTGRPAQPPRWALGFHQSRWGYWPDSRLDGLAAEFRARHLPLDALWLDIQHMDGFRTFTWDPAGFPDPAALAARLAADDLHLVTIADPGIKVDAGYAAYETMIAGDHALRRADGTLYTGTAWPGESAWPDVSDSGAREWWAGWVGTLANVGVSGIWLDVNEPTTFPEGGGGTTIDDDVPCAGDGVATTMAECHNVYALNEARATVEGLLAAAPDRRPFVLTRAGYAGIQRYAAAWTGDAPSTWESLDGALPMLLGLGMSGVPFVGTDVGGYSGGATAELFARWMALGAASPFFRSHVTTGVEDQEPWAFGTEVEDLSRNWLRWRYALLPTWVSLFDEATRTGAPPLRPLAWRWPADADALDADDEALIGDFLLVAPVTAEGATTRRVYLPEGRWFEVDSGAAFEGPTWVDADLRLAAMPRYVREGGILALAATGSMPDGGERTTEAGPDLLLDVYPGAEESRFTLYEDAGEGFAYVSGDFRRTGLRLAGDDGGATLTAESVDGNRAIPDRAVTVRVRRVDHAPTAVTLDGAALSEAESRAALDAGDRGWWWDPADLSVLVRFPDPGAFTLRVDYDPSLTALAPAVAVPLRVTVPAGTPTTDPIHVATDADGWAMHPLEWVDATTAVGTVDVPRGDWFEYKYTRGDWDTVEKWPDCVEAENRYAFGAADPGKDDEVYGWRDWCDGG